MKLIHLADTTENVSFEWRIGWWRFVAIYYSCLIWDMNISIIGSNFGVAWTFLIWLSAPALYRTRYSRHQRRWVGIPSSQLGDYVFSAFTSSKITINAFSNSITVLSEKIWIKDTLLYLHSGLFSLDSALIPFLFGSLCLVNFLNHISCSSD